MNNIKDAVKLFIKKDTWNDMDTICETLMICDDFVSTEYLSHKAIVNIPMSTLHRKLNKLELIGAIVSVTIPGEGRYVCWHESPEAFEDSF